MIFNKLRPHGYEYQTYHDRASLARINMDIDAVEKAMHNFLSKVTTWHRREYKPVLGDSCLSHGVARNAYSAQEE